MTNTTTLKDWKFKTCNSLKAVEVNSSRILCVNLYGKFKMVTWAYYYLK